jgi:hypothetical protein
MKRLIPLMTVIGLIFTIFLPDGGLAKIDPADIIAVWDFTKIKGNTVVDVEGKGINGTIVGNPKEANGIRDAALQFDGDDYISIPDSPFINTGGPFPSRTIIALFNCDDMNAKGKQTIYEEGGRTRGFCVYVAEGKVWVGGWNRAEYNWNGEWLSASIGSNEWRYVGLVLREGRGKVEKDKFEMWLDGDLVAKASGGQLHGHSDNIGIGATNQNTVFHDGDGSGTNRDFFSGIIDEVRLYSTPLTEEDMKEIMGGLFAVKPSDKLATTWGKIKG